MKIFAGSSNQALAKQVAVQMGISLGEIDLGRFENGEARVHIKEPNVNSTVVIIQSFSQPVDQNIVEFCLICDGAKRMGAKKIIAVIPWLGYSKQDKVFRGGEPLSIKVVAKMIQTAPFDELLTFDLHNQAIVGFFDKNVIQLSAMPLFADFFKKIKDENTICVAPDAGAIKASTEFASKLGLDMVYIDKKRDLKTGEVIIHGVSSDVSGKKILIVDDIVSTGATLVETANFLKSRGAESIMVGVTHHLFIRGVQEKLDGSPIDKLIVSDTVCPPQEQKSKKLEIISVGKIITEELKKLCD